MIWNYFDSPHHTRGFTLIELLVVIAIIGLLASTVLASLNSARAAARDAQRLQTVKSFQTALELYRNRTGGYPCFSTNPDCVSTTDNAANAWNVERNDTAFTGTELGILSALDFPPVTSASAPFAGGIAFRLRDTGVATNRADRTSYTIRVRMETQVFPTTGTNGDPNNPYCSISYGPGHTAWDGLPAGATYPPCF